MITLGCIADDFTGGTDVAAALRRNGLSVTLLFGTPDDHGFTPTTDAVVIALKTRTISASQAVHQSLEALSWLKERDVQHVYFKYCSTFDSTDEGNIGPVADALLGALDESTALICPASPEHGRTTYLGHLFVHDQLLSDSPMRDHPLTPMRESRIGILLARQTQATVSALSLPVIRRGTEAVAQRLGSAQQENETYVVVDAVTEDDLDLVARGGLQAGLRVWTGGAGLAGALGAALAGQHQDMVAPVSELPDGVSTLILAGSCSVATQGQVAAAVAIFPSHRLDPARTPDPRVMVDEAVAWVETNWGHGPLLVYSTAGPDDRAAAMEAMGPETPDILERTLGTLARSAVDLGVGRIVVAGGETSGAVVQALDIDMVEIAGEADRGVPWCLARTTSGPLALLLKSGNFGGEDLLVRASKEHP